MSSHSPRTRLLRLGGSLALATSLLLPGAAPAGAVDGGEPVVLRVGTTQDLEASNPWNVYLVVGYEAFALTWNLLTEFDQDARPAPGFAESWERSEDRVTFKMREGLLWSDGEPATSADVCFSWGLGLDAIENDDVIGYGYLEPGIKDAGVTRIECPDDNTFIAYTTDQSDRIFQVYVPILPQHVYGDLDYKAMTDAKFDPPLVGTGPYTMVEWQTGQFARFERNPNYWGNQGFQDEVVLQFFPDATDTMFQALRAGDLDYVHNVNSDQFDQLAAEPDTYTTVVGKANGWTQLAFNTYGTGTGETINNGGPSTPALLDAAFRDAIGYAIDKDVLVDRVLGGYGDVGTTIVPPILSEWHVEPTTPRSYDPALADQKLTAAGYVLDDQGRRLDKEGNRINLRLFSPNTSDDYAEVAQFVTEWYGALGIGVTYQALDSTTLGELILPPPDAKADYDIELWGWAGSPDPQALLQIFRCDAIGTTSDSQYCNPTFDALYDEQATQAGEERAATLAEMQNLIYDEAPYDILYYDANLVAYRNDRFAGWQNMPAEGTPLFTYGPLGYTLLTDATATPPPTEEPASPSEGTESPSSGTSEAPSEPTPAPSADGGSTATGGTNTALILAVVAIVVVVVVAGLVMSRRRRAGVVEDE
jgi:peptide/nickel transport system substrate-binding protein